MDKKRVRKFIIEAVILTVICALVTYALIKDSFFDICKLLKNLKAWNIIVLIAAATAAVACSAFVLRKVGRNFNPNYNIVDGTSCTEVGALFSGITPFKVGYQFSMLYMYNKKGIKPKDGIVISYVEGGIYTFLNTLLCIALCIFIALNPVTIEVGGKNININIAVYIVTGINVVFSLFLLLVTNFRRLHALFVNICGWFVKVFTKKDADVAKNKVREILGGIMDNSKMIYQRPGQSLLIMFVFLIKSLLIYSMPYFIYLFLSKTSFDWSNYISCLSYAMIITFCMWVLPIPGGAGASELLFYLLYSLVITNNVMIKASILVWRFFTYYIHLIVGLIILLILKNKEMIKETREKKKEIEQ